MDAEFVAFWDLIESLSTEFLEMRSMGQGLKGQVEKRAAAIAIFLCLSSNVNELVAKIVSGMKITPNLINLRTSLSNFVAHTGRLSSLAMCDKGCDESEVARKGRKADPLPTREVHTLKKLMPEARLFLRTKSDQYMMQTIIRANSTISSSSSAAHHSSSSSEASSNMSSSSSSLISHLTPADAPQEDENSIIFTEENIDVLADTYLDCDVIMSIASKLNRAWMPCIAGINRMVMTMPPTIHQQNSDKLPKIFKELIPMLVQVLCSVLLVIQSYFLLYLLASTCMFFSS